MKLTLASIGRLKASSEADLFQRFWGRIQATGPQIGLRAFHQIEHMESRQRSSEARKKEEGAKLLSALPKQAHIIALDEKGKSFTSYQFSQNITQLVDQSVSDLVFVIGGADGHGEELLSAAKTKLSLSPMTLPHGLARIVLTEQIYRAITIKTGHPYHRA